MKTLRHYSSLLEILAGLSACLIVHVAVGQTVDNPATEPDGTAEQIEVFDAESPAAAGPPVDSPADISVENSETIFTDSAATVEIEVIESPATQSTAVVPEQDSGPVESESLEVIALPDPNRPAKPRYKKADVLWIQRRLEELGYYTGTVDGAYGRYTREAIKAYQVDQELEQDGRPTSELRDFMWRNGG